MLRQQARLHSLHLSEDAEEVEETVPDQNKGINEEEEEEGRDSIHMPAELRVCCCQSMTFRFHRSISQHCAWQ